MGDDLRDNEEAVDTSPAGGAPDDGPHTGSAPSAHDLEPARDVAPAAAAAAAPAYDDDDDDDDDDDEIQVMSVLASYPTEAEAVADARRLVEHGVGATVVPVPATELEDDGPQAAYRIEVLPIDLNRGERALGIVESDDYDPDNPPELEKGATPWKTLLLVWIAAMVIVPAFAFFIAYNMFQGQ